MNRFGLSEDMHVHSTFSDGTATVLENIRRAEELGLRRICCVDHVRKSSDWLGEFVRAVSEARREASIEVFTGVEAKILNVDGELDVPGDISGVELIYAADHQFPWLDGPKSPAEMRALFRGGLDPRAAIDVLARATMNTLWRYRGVVLAHLFSILPKVGLSESTVPDRIIEGIARSAAASGALIEVDEKWRCPSLRTLRIFEMEGVPIVYSSDSHKLETLGRYDYNEAISVALSHDVTRGSYEGGLVLRRGAA